MKRTKNTLEDQLRVWKLLTIVILFLFSVFVVEDYKWLLFRFVKGGEVQISERTLTIPWNYCWIKQTPDKVLLVDVVHGLECAEISVMDSLPNLVRTEGMTLEANDCYRNYTFEGHKLVEFQISLKNPEEPMGESQTILIEDELVVINYFGRLSSKYEFLSEILEGTIPGTPTRQKARPPAQSPVR